MRDAAINRILHSSLRLVGNGNRGLAAMLHRQVREKLGDITRAEHLMNSCKMYCPLVVAKIRSENASFVAFPPQKLAGAARRRDSRHGSGLRNT